MPYGVFRNGKLVKVSPTAEAAARWLEAVKKHTRPGSTWRIRKVTGVR